MDIPEIDNFAEQTLLSTNLLWVPLIQGYELGLLLCKIQDMYEFNITTLVLLLSQIMEPVIPTILVLFCWKSYELNDLIQNTDMNYWSLLCDAAHWKGDFVAVRFLRFRRMPWSIFMYKVWF